jgi:8-oxo-dGTP pyrophosphatase MutT (NUDIX family)
VKPDLITRQGAMAVVLSGDRRQVLLLRRDIFILWDLPGGAIEEDEAPSDAAVRETLEETGYQIKIDRLVGQYLHQSVYGRGDQRTYAFEGHVAGGKPRHFGLETIGLRWCHITELPLGMQPLQRQMIVDALSGAAEPFSRQILFPMWKLWPARAVFIPLKWIKSLLFPREHNRTQKLKKG